MRKLTVLSASVYLSLASSIVVAEAIADLDEVTLGVVSGNDITSSIKNVETDVKHTVISDELVSENEAGEDSEDKTYSENTFGNDDDAHIETRVSARDSDDSGKEHDSDSGDSDSDSGKGHDSDSGDSDSDMPEEDPQPEEDPRPE